MSERYEKAVEVAEFLRELATAEYSDDRVTVETTMWGDDDFQVEAFHTWHLDTERRYERWRYQDGKIYRVSTTMDDTTPLMNSQSIVSREVLDVEVPL